jgi:hypothetical protein
MSAPLTEARVREIAREEQRALVDALLDALATSLPAGHQIFSDFTQVDRRAGRKQEPTHSSLDGHSAFVDVIYESHNHRTALDDTLHRLLNCGRLFASHFERVTRVVKSVFRRHASPSLAGLDNLSVGDRPGPAEEAGPGHTQGGAL